MKRELKRKYLHNYRQDAFMKFHNFKLSVEEYTAKFDHLMIRCDIVESEEQMVAHYLGRLHAELNDVVQLHPSTSLLDLQCCLQACFESGVAIKENAWQ